jgi:phosphatidylserine decarboxylase
MKHSGKARKAAFSLIFWTLVLLVLLVLAGVLAVVFGSLVVSAATLLVLGWVVFVVFTLYFFRDPSPRVPVGDGLVVSPGHGKVDVIDETTESEFIDGPCKRISMFLSVFDVHVQNAPVTGRIVFYRYREGKFLNALNADCAAHNENALYGFEAHERDSAKIGVRLIAGLIARRLVPWAAVGDEVVRGERLSLIQFGSRVEIYLPLSAQVRVKLGDRVKGGETVVAQLT